ncbi:MAG: hypothetical protein Q7W29_01330 [bacterium]|nr:hypothetical protein [bacterium]
MWNVAFFMPLERDVPLLAEAARRDDVRLLGVVAPDRASPAAALAEVMGLTVWSGLDEAPFPRDTLLVGSADADPSTLRTVVAARGWRHLEVDGFRDLLHPAPEAPLPVAEVAAASPPAPRVAAEALARSLDRDLADLAGGARDLPGILAAWSSTLALRLDARHAALALLREDGTLLLAEGTPAGETRLEDADAGASPWREVFATARPLVAVEQEAADGLHLTVWPLVALDGDQPAPVPRAALAVGHLGAEAAARFQALGEVLAPVLGLRCELLRRQVEHEALVARFHDVTATAMALSNTKGDAASALSTALKHCCGALAAEPRPDGADPVYGGIAAGEWLAFATPERRPRLILRDGDVCWDLLGKQRRHPWDAAHFTGDDAAAAGLLLAAVRRRPAATAVPVAASVPLAADPAPPTIDVHPPHLAGLPPGAAAVPESLLDLLAREMDRADRYHGAFSVSAFRAPTLLGPHLSGLAARLRSSDRVFCHDPGTLLVFAPDENHAVAQLEQRVRDALPDLAGVVGLRVKTGRALYPGRFTSPVELVAAALAGLDTDTHGD